MIKKIAEIELKINPMVEILFNLHHLFIIELTDSK